MRKHTLATILSCVCLATPAQEEHQTWEKYFSELTTLEDAEAASWEATYEVLGELAEHPLNINTATREELERLPFLTEQQVEDICAYLYQYGEMRALGELAMIESLGYHQRQLLEQFVYAGKKDSRQAFPSLQTIGKYGKHELLATTRIPCYTRQGDRTGYLGYPYKHWTRYNFSYSDYVKAGIVGANDAGEPFFGNHNRAGYDHYSVYLTLRRLGRLKALAVGHYRLKFGMGLALNNDHGFGKIATLAALGRGGNSIRAHSSRTEGNYLQGAAATVTVAKGLDVTGFVSYRDIDATLSKGGDTIMTIRSDGYHRTETEMAHKHNASQLLAGGNLRYFRQGFHVGATAFHTSLDKPLHPDKAPLYRRYLPEGKAFYNVSVDYGYTSRRLTVNGETATGDCHALATFNSLSYMVSGSLSLLAVQRFYSYRYYSLFAESFSDGGSVQNESGCYFGASWQPTRSFSLMAYADYAYFPWARYQRDGGTHRGDILAAIAYKPGRLAYNVRYRLREKKHTGRAAVSYATGAWDIKAQGDLTCERKEQRSLGWMVSGNASYRRQRLRLNASIGYFHTDDYNSRIYCYEPGTLYSYAFTAYAGEGIRYAACARADIGKHVTLIAKVATTDYLDRDHISSGYQQVDHSAVTDLDLQLKWKF